MYTYTHTHTHTHTFHWSNTGPTMGEGEPYHEIQVVEWGLVTKRTKQYYIQNVCWRDNKMNSRSSITR